MAKGQRPKGYIFPVKRPPRVTSSYQMTDRFRGITSDLPRDFTHRFSHLGLTPHHNG
jgi:hypothetical protein